MDRTLYVGVDESSSDLSASSANFLMQCIRHTSLFSSFRNRYLGDKKMMLSFYTNTSGMVSLVLSPILAHKRAVLKVWKFKESKNCL